MARPGMAGLCGVVGREKGFRRGKAFSLYDEEIVNVGQVVRKDRTLSRLQVHEIEAPRLPSVSGGYLVNSFE